YKLSITGDINGYSYSILSPSGLITTTFPTITSTEQLKVFLETTYPLVFPQGIQLYINNEGELIIQQTTSYIFDIITPPGNYIETVIVPQQVGLTPIGWGQLGEDLIIFTCPSTQNSPDP